MRCCSFSLSWMGSYYIFVCLRKCMKIKTWSSCLHAYVWLCVCVCVRVCVCVCLLLQFSEGIDFKDRTCNNSGSRRREESWEVEDAITRMTGWKVIGCIDNIHSNGLYCRCVHTHTHTHARTERENETKLESVCQENNLLQSTLKKSWT